MKLIAFILLLSALFTSVLTRADSSIHYFYHANTYVIESINIKNINTFQWAFNLITRIFYDGSFKTKAF